MIMTVLEARVDASKSETLEKAFKEAITEIDPGIVQTFLVHSLADTTLWRIITVWSSREALNAMRQSGQTPRGVLIFRAAQAEATLSVYNVAAHAMVPL